MAENEIMKDAAEEKKELDFTNLEERLEELTALDYIQAERECRMAADTTTDITYSASFRARLVAAAMGVSYNEISSLKIKVYTAAIERTLLFLLGNLAKTVIQRNS